MTPHRSGDSSRRRFLQTAGTVALLWAAPQPADAGEPAAGPKKSRLKLGLASYSTRKFNLERTLEMTRRVGLEYLCLKSFHLPLEAKPDEIAAAAAKVQQAGIILYAGGVITLQKEAQVDQAFDYAQAAGMKMIIAAPSAAMLPSVEKKVKATGISVAIHNHGPGDKHFPTPESIYEKIKDLDGRIGLCIDIGHTVRIGADLIDSTRKFAARVLDIHIKDVSAANPKGKEVIIGRGVIDIPGFLRVLLEIKFAGVVSFEYEDRPDDPLPGLAQSVGYIQGVLAALA